MTNDQLDGLVALKLVAERRNFAAAAKILGISPSAMSQVIKQLERRLGIALLTRTTRTVNLTEAGERFLAQAGPAIDQILTALNGVGDFAAKPSGLLRINLPRAIYASYLAPIVTSFQKRFPEISVELFFEDGISDVVASGFDAGIRLSDILAKDMVAVKLFGPVRFVVAGAPKYLAKAGRPKHPKDLLGLDCILGRLSMDRIYDRWEFEHKGAEFAVQVKGSLIMNDSTFARQAAIDGAGLIYTTEDSIVAYVRAKKLEIVLAPYATSSTGFYLYYPSRAQVQPKLRAFIDHLRRGT